MLRREVAGAWESLRQEMLDRGAGSIVSMEFLSHGSAEQAREVVKSLAPAQVHVVLTLRDAVGIVPAQWQTDVRNAQTDTWPDYMASVRRSTGLRARLSNRLGNRLGRVAAGRRSPGSNASTTSPTSSRHGARGSRRSVSTS